MTWWPGATPAPRGRSPSTPPCGGEDIELDGPRPTITVQHSADTRKQTDVSTTKTGEERRVRIGPRMAEVLRRHRARQLEERMKASSWEDPGLVFPNTKGKIRRRDSAVRSFKRYLEEAGIPTDVRSTTSATPPVL